MNFNELQIQDSSVVRHTEWVIFQVPGERWQGIPQGLKPAFVVALSAKAKALAYLEAKAKAYLEAKARATRSGLHRCCNL